MSLNTMKQHGAFSWNELMTTDINAAKSFYGELFGWSLDDLNVPGMPYTIAKVDGKEVAGLMLKPPEAEKIPSCWGSFVTVDNVENSIEKAAKLGAKIVVEPRDIPDVGQYAVIIDPQGAMLSMISYLDTMQ